MEYLESNVFQMEDSSTTEDLINENNLRTLETVRNLETSESQGLLYTLTLAKTTRQMGRVIIYTYIGLVNGSTEGLKGIELNIGRRTVTPWLRHSYETIGNIAGSKKRQKTSTEEICTLLEKVIRSFEYKTISLIPIGDNFLVYLREVKALRTLY